MILAGGCAFGTEGGAHEKDRLIAEATAVKDRHMDELLKLPAVVGAGIGTSKKHPGKAVIQVFVSRRLKEPERKLFPKRLEGVPVEVVVTGAFRPMGSASKKRHN